MKQFSRHRQLLFCAAHFLGYFHLRRHIPLRRHIYTRTAPNLFLTKTTKLTSHGTSRCPASSSYPIRSPTATYTRRNQRAFCVFGRLWKFVLPEVRSSHHLHFVASTSCHLLIFFARNFVKFVKWVWKGMTELCYKPILWWKGKRVPLSPRWRVHTARTTMLLK